MNNELIKKSIKNLISEKPSGWLEKAKWREENKPWLDKSAKIALSILLELDARNLTQKDLAAKMGVSPQQVNKIVKGEENLTLETVSKIETLLGVSLIEVPTLQENQKINYDLSTPVIGINRSKSKMIGKITGSYHKAVSSNISFYPSIKEETIAS